MQRKNLKLFILELSILLLFVSLPSFAKSNLPPILDYYPSCAYEVIGKTEVKAKTSNKTENEVVKQLLKELRDKAKINGANALILTRRHIEKYENSALYFLSYKAEFITSCHDSNPNNKKLTKIDSQGRDNYALITEAVKFEFKFPNKAELNHPLITNNNVSIATGLYGINIGTTYHKVIELFGDPSTEILINIDEIILSYGRNHWLHFIKDELVNIQTNKPLLSQELINKIPLRKFFDDSTWKINNKIMRGSTLDQVKSALKIKSELNNENQLIFKNKDNVMTLFFSRGKNHHTGQYSNRLSGFSLKAKSFKPNYSLNIEQDIVLYKIMTNFYIDLIKEGSITWSELEAKLGFPIGKITLTPSSQLYIYNSHLLVKRSHSNISALYFIEQTLKDEYLSKTPWNFGPFSQGASISLLKEYIPTDAFVLDNIIEFETNNYNLSLLFDQNNEETSLYEVKMTLF